MANPAADYPASVHTATDVPANTGSALGATSPTHTQVEGKQEAEIVAIQTKIGVGASPASSATTGYVLTKQSDGSTAWAVSSGSSLADGDKGDITVATSGTVWTIDNDAVSNAKSANMAVNTIKGRVTSGTGDPEDLSAANVMTILGITSSAAELNILDGATLDVTELNYVDGVTSAIQTQLNNKQPLDTDLTTIASLTATTDNFMVSVSSAWASRTPAQVRSTLALVIGTNVQAWSANLDEYSAVNPTAAGLDLLDDANTATQLVTLGFTASITELNYTDGVTSAIQTQIDTKAPLASPTFTGTVTLPVGLTGVIRTDTGVVSVDSDVTDLVTAASTSAAGKVELATTAETETGTDTTRAVTPDGLHDMTTLSGAAWFLDEDDMVSDSAVKTASQQSIKAYVDSVAQGLSIKNSVLMATAAALPTNLYSNGASGVGATLTGTSNGALTVDGVAVTAGDRVLVKDESTGANNGIYTVTVAGSVGAVYVLTRATDFNQAAEIPGGFVFVESGTANSDSGWVCTTDPTVTVGTTSLSFTQFSGAGQITAGSALTKTGNTLDVAVDGSTIEVSTDALRVKDDGITYAKIQNVSATARLLGRVTSGSGDVEEVVIDADLSSVSDSDDTVPSAKATKTALDLKAPLASPTFTGTVTLPTGLTGVIRADTGVVSVDSDITDLVSAASTALAGKVELATDAETNTGTDTVRAITPSNLEAWTGSAQVTTVGTLASGNATTIVDAATTSAAGKVELATSAETTTGTDTDRAVTPAAAAATYTPTIMDGTPNTDHTAVGPQTSTFNAGATITVMDLVYMGSGGKWLLTDADAAATTGGLLAISLESKVDTEAMKVALPASFVRDDTWNWTPGATLYVDTATAGQIVATQPSGTDDAIRVVGFAVTADVIYFLPSGDYITHT